MIGKLYWYRIECKACGLIKDIASPNKEGSTEFNNEIFRNGWTLVKYWNDSGYYDTEIFCARIDCQVVADMYRIKK